MAPQRMHGEEPARDVLAADEFVLPGPDPRLRPRPVVLPEDPSGIAEPHDVLAAEEFAMPGGAAMPGLALSGGLARGSDAARWSRLGAAAAALALVGLGRRRR